LCGGVLLVAGGWLLGERVEAMPSARGWLAVAYLAVFGSIVAFSAYAWLLQNVRASLLGSYAYVNPVIAVLLGTLLAGERFSAHDIGAMSVILAGVVAITVASARRRRQPAVQQAPSTVAEPIAAASDAGHAERAGRTAGDAAFDPASRR